MFQGLCWFHVHTHWMVLLSWKLGMQCWPGSGTSVWLFKTTDVQALSLWRTTGDFRDLNGGMSKNLSCLNLAVIL